MLRRSSISILYVFVAIAFGLFLHKAKIDGWKQAVLGIVLIVICLRRIAFLFICKAKLVIFSVCLYFSSQVSPLWLLKQPRDYLTTFLFVGMIIATVIGVVISNPTIST